MSCLLPAASGGPGPDGEDVSESEHGKKMKRYRIEVRITPRDGLLDPQGKAVEHALHSLEFGSVAGVHVGRLIRLDLEAPDEGEARDRADEMCRKLLANPVTEDYDITVEGA
jgi:phosphoribosylformylglycinamidine synthase subunit PurS